MVLQRLILLNSPLSRAGWSFDCDFDMKQENEKIRLKIPAEVARIMSKWGGHQIRLAAARGAVPMSGPNLVMVLFVFYHGENQELKDEALNTLKALPANIILSALTQPELHPSIIDLIVHLRYQDAIVMQQVIMHPMTAIRSLLFLAQKSSGDVLEILALNDEIIKKADVIRTTIINNPHTARLTKVRLGWTDPAEIKKGDSRSSDKPQDGDSDSVSAEGGDDEQLEDEEFIDETEGLTKYQLLQDMPVSEKIKMALTGDKEWRTLLIREPNKQVCTAVLKNPRISEGEVLAVAKNRSAHEELIRVILLNRDWTKLYDMKKALVSHPRTPLQQAIKFMGFLSERDVRDLAKSKNVTQVIVNNARRMLMAKKKR